MNSFIHSGSTLLNLALTGKADSGWPLGRISNVVGDRSSGKTLLAIEAASMFLNCTPQGIKKPRVIYCEAEAAFDETYASEKLGMPVGKVEFELVETIEELYILVDGVCKNSKKGSGTLIILDSLDSISSAAEMKKGIDKQDYDRKAQKLSEMFRKLVRKIEEANVHLMVISQVRENITAIPFAPKWRRSGGKALDFYATHIVWLAEVGKLKSVKTKRAYGVEVEAKVTKNKVSSPHRDLRFNVLFEYGIDEIESMVKFLVKDELPAEFALKKKAGGFYLWREEYKRMSDIVDDVENVGGEYIKLVDMVQAGWDELEKMTKVDRKNKSELLMSKT